jgi:hypothetical protein
MTQPEQTDDVYNMALLFGTSLNKALLTSTNLSHDVADIARCLLDWADSLDTGADLDMTTDHWTKMIGALQ